MKTIISYWQKVPAPVRTWLKGLEVFVLMGVVTSLMAAPFADFTTKGGIAKFAGIVAATAGGCVRLYLIQSPVQNVIQETVLASKSPSGQETVIAQKTTGPDPTIPPSTPGAPNVP